MRVMGGLALLVALAAVGVLAWIRLAPSDPARWHVDPLAVTTPVAVGHALLRPEDGDGAAPVYALPPEDLLAAFDRVARAEPRVQVLAGSVASGRITYVVRSRLVGFPDYLTVRALPAPGGGATLAIFSRQRFGLKDMGVNRARVEAWLAALAAALPPGTVRPAPGA